MTIGRLYASMNAWTAYRLSGSRVYFDRSKECLLDMMKASKLRGKAGQAGMALAAPLLIMTLLDAGWGHIGKSAAEHQQAEQFLQEALQVHI